MIIGVLIIILQLFLGLVLTCLIFALIACTGGEHRYKGDD